MIFATTTLKNSAVLHPNDVEKYQKFKINKLRYSIIFDEFMHGQINRDQLIDLMEKADQKDIKDNSFDYEVSMVDLVTKEHKISKLAIVD